MIKPCGNKGCDQCELFLRKESKCSPQAKAGHRGMLWAEKKEIENENTSSN